MSSINSQCSMLESNVACTGIKQRVIISQCIKEIAHVFTNLSD
jgi:hypothetical protein